MGCNLDNLQVLEPISEHKTGAAKTVNLFNYLRFCGNIMYTADPNDNLCLTKATRMDTNGCDMPNDSNISLFLGNRGCCRSAWGQNEDLDMF